MAQIVQQGKLSGQYQQNKLDSKFFGGATSQPDPYFASVVALLHMDGVDGSQVYTDVIGKTWTKSVGATSAISSLDPKWGTGSFRKPVNGDGFIASESHADFGYGTGKFVIEMWVNFSTVTGTMFFFDQRPNASLIFAMVDGAFWFYSGGAFRIQANNIFTLPNTWYHVAYARSGTTDGQLFTNGVLTGTYVDVTDYAASVVTLGCPSDTPNSLNLVGKLDDVRITKGVDRGYIGGFAVPTGPFANSLPA